LDAIAREDEDLFVLVLMIIVIVFCVLLQWIHRRVSYFDLAGNFWDFLDDGDDVVAVRAEFCF
jgi:hypothetical protein